METPKFRVTFHVPLGKPNMPKTKLEKRVASQKKIARLEARIVARTLKTDALRAKLAAKIEKAKDGGIAPLTPAPKSRDYGEDGD